MKVQCSWQGQMKFVAGDQNHQVSLDAQPPLGGASALSPKQLLLASICGCTAMDVIALLKKHQQKPDHFEVSAEAHLTLGSYPVVFDRIVLHFKVSGEVEGHCLIQSVDLSQSKYCGVSAMVSKAVKILYTIELNGVRIHEGHSEFKF